MAAYGVVHYFPGATQAQYEASIAAAHPSRDQLPDGQIFHAADGFGVSARCGELYRGGLETTTDGSVSSRRQSCQLAAEIRRRADEHGLVGRSDIGQRKIHG